MRRAWFPIATFTTGSGKAVSYNLADPRHPVAAGEWLYTGPIVDVTAKDSLVLITQGTDGIVAAEDLQRPEATPQAKATRGRCSRGCAGGRVRTIHGCSVGSLGLSLRYWLSRRLCSAAQLRRCDAFTIFSSFLGSA